MIDKIKELHFQGMTNRKIAQIVGCHHTTVGSKIRLLGLYPNGNGPKKLNIIGDGIAVCSKCNKELPIEQFQYSHTNKGRLSYCNGCRNKQNFDRISASLDSYLNHRVNQVKVRAKKLGIPFNLDFDFVLGQYLRQYGNCFYTNITLDVSLGKGHNDNALSFDRVVPTLGYTKDNVVLCTNKVNTCKNNISLEEMEEWMPGWYEKVKMWRETGIRTMQVANGAF